jgi:serine/threonine-protein kinase
MASSFVGTRSGIGNYEVIRKLASGGMGEVYLARQRGPVDFRRDVVLKRLHQSYTQDPQMVRMFLNEARIAASLSHPSIIHLYELFEDGDGYVIAMEYVRGGTVLSLLRANAEAGVGIPYGPAVRIALAVCDALHYAYTTPDEEGRPRRVIHRDISPSNVLVGYDGNVKLADFGVAKMLDVEATKGTTIKGKHGYLSPEQARCLPLDQRSDMFSLATVLWEMTTGRRLFHRENEVQMMYAVVEDEIPRPSQRVPGYPQPLEEVVMRALARQRDDRYPDTLAMARELRRVARDLGWDLEAAALARVVRDSLPADEVAFGTIGSDSFSGVNSREELTAGSWGAPGASDALRVELVTTPAKPALPEHRPAARSYRDVWVTIAVMLVLSAVFWTVIVPRLP